MSIKDLQSALLGRVKNYTANAKTTYNSERDLFNLLIDHPVYIKRIVDGRKKLLLPIDGFDSQKEAFDWEYKNRKIKLDILELSENILKGFTIPSALKSDAVNFTYDYLLSEKRVLNELTEDFSDPKWKDELQDMIGKKKITLQLIHSTNDRELNKYIFEENALYFKVNPEIRFEDLVEAYKEIRKIKKEVRPFYIPRPQEICRLIWRLRLDKRKPKEIISVLKEKYRKKIDNHFIDVYTQRYKKDLKKLLKF